MKIKLMGAAEVAMMLASCTSEEVVSQNADGKMFALKVSMNAGSRTALDGLQTVWSAGDRIYVTSKDGKTTGVLTLKSEPGQPNGTFEGYVFGDGELNYAVYPVPVDGKKDMGKANIDRLDAPMTGDISAGATTFGNACGLVKLNVLGVKEGDVVNVSGTGIGSVIKYDLATNSWVQETAGANISVYGVGDAAEFFVPVYTTNTTASDVTLQVSVNDGEPADVTIPVAVKSVNAEAPILAVTSEGDVVDPSDPEVKKELGNNYVYVKTTDDLFKILGTADGAGTAGDGAYIVLQKGIHEVDYNEGGQLAITKDLTIVGEEGTVIEGGYYTGNSSARALYIYCSAVKNLAIRNVTFKKKEGQEERELELWFSGKKPNYMQKPDNDLKTNVLLENVNVEKVRLENYYGYVENLIMDVEVTECTIDNMYIENWGRGNLTYFTYDKKSEISLNYNISAGAEKNVIVTER